MNQGDAGAAAEKVERRFGGGVFPPITTTS